MHKALNKYTIIKTFGVARFLPPKASLNSAAGWKRVGRLDNGAAGWKRVGRLDGGAAAGWKRVGRLDGGAAGWKRVGSWMVALLVVGRE